MSSMRREKGSTQTLRSYHFPVYRNMVCIDDCAETLLAIPLVFPNNTLLEIEKENGYTRVFLVLQECFNVRFDVVLKTDLELYERDCIVQIFTSTPPIFVDLLFKFKIKY